MFSTMSYSKKQRENYNNILQVMRHSPKRLQMQRIDAQISLIEDASRVSYIKRHKEAHIPHL